MNKNYETCNCTANDSVNSDKIATAMTSLAYHCLTFQSLLPIANIMNHEGCGTQQNMSIEIIWFSMCKNLSQSFFSFLCVPPFVYIFVYIFLQPISNVFHYTNQLSFYRRAVKTRSELTGKRRDRII